MCDLVIVQSTRACLSLVGNGFCLLSLWYAHQRGVHFVIEQPMTSVGARKAFCSNCVCLKVLWHYDPVRRFLDYSMARTHCFKESSHVSGRPVCRRVSFPMGSFGAPTLKYTVCPGSIEVMSNRFDILKGLPKIKFESRLYGTLPDLGTLRRLMDMKQLRKACAETLVFWSSFIFLPPWPE